MWWTDLAGGVAALLVLLACGFPTKYGAAEYLESCTVPKIFIQSTKDQYSPRVEFEKHYARFADPKKLIWVEAQDHFFAGALDQFESAVSGADAHA